MPVFIYAITPLAKAFVAEHQRRLKNGKTVTIAAYYDKRVKKAAQHAPEPTHNVSHLTDADQDKFSRMHKEQHVAHFYEAHALSRKLAAEQQLLATLERYEDAGDNKSMTAVHNKIYALKQHIRRHERDLSRAKLIVEGLGKMKHKLAAGSGELKDDADKQHAHYVGKLGERFAADKQKPDFKPDYNKKVPVLTLTDDPDMPIEGSAKELGKYLMDKYRNLQVTNKDTGVGIGIYQKGLKSSLKNRNKLAKRAYAILPDLLKNAVLTGIEKNTKFEQKPGVLAYETFHAAVNIDGNLYAARIIVDVMKDEARGRGYYYHQVEDIAFDALVGTPPTQPNKNQASMANASDTEITLRELLEKVNENKVPAGLTGSLTPTLPFTGTKRDINTSVKTIADLKNKSSQVENKVPAGLTGSLPPNDNETLDEFENRGGEAWQVPQSKWTQLMSDHFKSLNQQPTKSDISDFKEHHRSAVKEALDAGKKVPKNVLSDYPGMKAETKEEKAARVSEIEKKFNALLGQAAGETNPSTTFRTGLQKSIFYIRKDSPLAKSFIPAHTRRLKNGKTVTIAAYYDKRVKKAAQHAPDHNHNVSHLSDDDKAKFSNMHKEQHVARFYEQHALERKLASEQQLLATLERSAKRYEDAGDNKSMTAVHNKIYALNQHIRRHERDLSRAKMIVEGLGKMKEKHVKGSGTAFEHDEKLSGLREKQKEALDNYRHGYAGKFIEEVKDYQSKIDVLEAKADQQHAHYVGKLGAVYQDKPKRTFKPDLDKEVKVLALDDDPNMPIEGSAKELGKYLMDKYRNLQVTNKDTGVGIGIYRGGIESSLKNRKPTARRLYAILPQLLENAVLTGVEKNTKTDKKPGVLAYETFHAPVSIDGNVYAAKIIVDVMKGVTRGRGYYYHQVEDVELSALVGSTRAQPEKKLASTPNALRTKITVGQLLGGVNENKVPAGLTGSETPTLPFTGDNQGNDNASDKSIAQPEKNISTDGLNPNSPDYRYRDTGNVAGSRKEQATNRIKMAGKTGERLNATDIDWQEIEQNPREAQTLITKANLFGVVDWNAIKANGMEPGAGFLIDKVYRSIDKEPENTEQSRKDYALGLQTIRDRMEQCKTPDDVMKTLAEIAGEHEGKMIPLGQQAEYQAANDEAERLRQAYNKVQVETNHAYEANRKATSALGNAQWEQEKRQRRGWKPDDKLNASIPELKAKVEQTNKVWGDLVAQKKPIEEKLRAANSKANDIQRKAQEHNSINNPTIRAWNSLGEKFIGLIKRGYRYGGLNYDQFNPAIYKSGNKTFLNHAINAKKGDIKDWSWAEKDPRTGTGESAPREKPFQLLVADKITRKGGKQINIDSTKALKDLVGLRDVQSGNWVLKDKDSAIFHVQKCAEAFSDLSDILDVPLSKIALNGRLALAFGARGQGNALAHYEPVQRVINLTKMKGGGSLAHEWLHSVDNMIAEMEGGKAGTVNHYVSENPELLPDGKVKDAVITLRTAMMAGDTPKKEPVQYTPQDLAKAKYNFDEARNGLQLEIKNAGSLDKAIDAVNDRFKNSPDSKNAKDWRKLVAAYYDNNAEGGRALVATGEKHSSFAEGALNLDKRKYGKYWSKPREMAARAFEAYVTDKLKAESRENTYLSAHADNNGYKSMGNYQPYPQGEDRTRINAAFDDFFAALRESGTLHKALGMNAQHNPKRAILFFSKASAEANMQKSIFYIRKDSPLAKSFIPAHTRRLKNGKVIQVAAYSDKRLRKDAAAMQVDHGDIKAKDKDQWARLHKEQHVLHHTDKALHERRIKEANKTIAHHHAKAAHHEAQRDIARKNGDSAALSEHNKALAHHHNQAQKWTNSRASHERHLAKVDHKLEGIKALKEQLWKGSGEVGETSDFGPVYRQFKHDAKGAIEHLKLMKTGEAVAALHHPEVGDIDLVWGKEGAGKSDGLGLAKLVKYHPEVVDNLQAILFSMKKDDTRSTAKRLQLESKNHQAAIRLDWDGKQKHWLLTAFEKRVGDSTRTDIMGLAGRDDTARSSTNSDKSITEPPKKASQKATESDTEKKLRDLWTTQGVSKERQDELIAQVTRKSRQGAKVGPFTISKKDNTSSLKPKTDGHRIDSKKQPKITPTGKENEVKTARGTKVNTQFAVVEASDLITSHDANGNANTAYPKELQPRNRERATSQAQIARIAKNLDPDMLGRTRNASAGAPIVGNDGVVESGNGRTLAINQAYQTGNADDYREWLHEIADMYGLDENKIKAMKHPVLVRVRKTDVDRAQFAREANQSDMLAMTATEKAKADSNHLTDAVIGKLSIDGDLSAASNRNFIMAFMGKLGDDESAGLMTTSGQPTKQLYDRAQSAIFAKAYNDDRLLELMADTDKPEIANIIKSLNQAAPSFITARSISEHQTQATTSKLTDAVDMSLDKKAVDAIVKATEMLKRAKDTNIPIEKFVKQGDMFGDIDPVVAQMALFISDNNRSPARMGEAFKAMADFLVKELTHQQTISLFDDEKPINMVDVIKAANTYLQKQYGEQAKTIGSRTGGFIDVFTETRGQKTDRERFLASYPEEPVTVRKATQGKVFKIQPPPQEDEAQQSRVFADAPIITMDVDISGDTKSVIDQAKDFAKNKLAGKNIHNRSLNHDIIVSMSGVKHTLSGSTGRNLALSVFKLPQMIKEGLLIGSLPDKKGNKSVKQHHYLGVKINIAGKVHDVVMDIREMADGHFYYDHSFEKVSGSGATPLSQPDKPVTGTTLPERQLSPTESIVQPAKKANGQKPPLKKCLLVFFQKRKVA